MQVGTVCLLLKRHYFLGSVAFCASLNHKQMTLYFAPAIFAHLLGICIKQGSNWKRVGYSFFGAFCLWDACTS